mmetsp:Transcript_5046/g.9862  ORF Transcript_5046/g.9862 Transcript_5046/m.9862 type:complete len:207 (+) Transcript_5046:3364-3984(+)
MFRLWSFEHGAYVWIDRINVALPIQPLQNLRQVFIPIDKVQVVFYGIHSKPLPRRIVRRQSIVPTALNIHDHAPLHEEARVIREARVGRPTRIVCEATYHGRYGIPCPRRPNQSNNLLGPVVHVPHQHGIERQWSKVLVEESNHAAHGRVSVPKAARGEEHVNGRIYRRIVPAVLRQRVAQYGRDVFPLERRLVHGQDVHPCLPEN